MYNAKGNKKGNAFAVFPMKYPNDWPNIKSFKDNRFIVVARRSLWSDLAGKVFNYVDRIPVVSDSIKKGKAGENLYFTRNDFAQSFNDPDADELRKIKIMTLPNNGALKLGTSSV